MLQSLPSSIPVGRDSGIRIGPKAKSLLPGNHTQAITQAGKQEPTRCTHMGRLLQSLADENSPLRIGLRWTVRVPITSPAPHCATCSVAILRPLLCLTCTAFYCPFYGSHKAAPCISGHGHPFYLDVAGRSVFCVHCKDMVYHPSIEKTISFEKALASERSLSKVFLNYMFLTSLAAVKPFLKRALPADFSSTVIPKSYLRPPPRGMRNLGQTCYMAVILQSFLHNPLLRAFYLTDGHVESACPAPSSSNSPCIGCEMDRLFVQAFTLPPDIPFTPNHFLYATWQKSNELNGYAQHDAHEFLISTLDHLHSSTPGHVNSNCKCFVHRIFSGTLQSQITCVSCKHCSLSQEPFLDLSLGIKSTNSTGTTSVARLQECLGRFTTAEDLASYTCAECKSTSGAQKRLLVHHLPPVLSLQLKRFEHNASSQKVDSTVRFPLKLDMKPYSSSNYRSFEKDERFAYDLTSVVCHEGQLNNGHFTVYCRNLDDGDFYWFDDDKVKRVPLQDVMSSKAYLLTYVKRITIPELS